MVITVSICNPWNLQTPISHVHLRKTLGRRESKGDHTSQLHILMLDNPACDGNGVSTAIMKCPPKEARTPWPRIGILWPELPGLE